MTRFCWRCHRPITSLQPWHRERDKRTPVHDVCAATGVDPVTAYPYTKENQR